MDTIAAIATGASVSAIGIVRLSGDRAIEAVKKVFFPLSGEDLEKMQDRKLIYGELRSLRGELLDLCLCTVSHSPFSYTGEDTAELQCHGSPMVLRTLLEELFHVGVRQALPGEFTKRAFLNGKIGLTSAEAVADLIDAETQEAVRNAAGQLSGAISRKTDSIYSDLTDICAHYHAVLDYPDEDIEDFRISAYRDTLTHAKAELLRLLKSFDRGKMMNSGIPAAIIGKPNAGKSSLLNALLGYDRAIVTSIPGTTRDTIEEKLKIGNVLLRLTDTAGIRDAEDEAERIGVERSYGALNSARLVILVLDGTTELTDTDRELLSYAEKAENAIVAVSKQDMSTFSAVGVETSLPVIGFSSLTGEGLDALEAEIGRLFPIPDVPAGEILTNARQAEAVSAAVEYLSASEEAIACGNTPDIVLTEVEGAMTAIGELNGKTIREDVTNRIFARFCVGK